MEASLRTRPSFFSNRLLQFGRNRWLGKAFRLRNRWRKRRGSSLVCAVGIEIEDIRKWFQGQLQERKQLIAMDNGDTTAASTSTSGSERVNFDLNLAVVLAGFAFESYNTPPKNSGMRESDGESCETTYLDKRLLRDLYQGQLTVKLLRAESLSGLDLWGTSDPYVWLRIGDSAQRSRTVWASRDPVWNDTLTLNVVDPSEQLLQVAVWDDNILSVHRRLGNTELPLDAYCDGSVHEVKLELEGGGTIFLEVSYKSFAEMEWQILPFISELIKGASVSSILTLLLGKDGIKVQDFVGSAFGALQIPLISTSKEAAIENIVASTDTLEAIDTATESIGFSFDLMKNLKSFGLELPQLGWSFDAQDALNRLGMHSQAQAQSAYMKDGLAHPIDGTPDAESTSQASPPATEVQAALLDVLGHTEELLGSWLMAATPFMKQDAEMGGDVGESTLAEDATATALSNLSREEMAEMFKRAESAMEAWTLLATSLGRTSFVKSEFEKICFVENTNTDTQVAVWRDVRGKRLVIAFRGTEQTKWRDLATDLMIASTRFNLERGADGDHEKEILVHTGFLSAYDSVRHRLMSVIMATVGYREADEEDNEKWHIYATGHSLGGALATLLAMDLSHTEMFKCGKVKLTMYNFGSPRVGNKAFAEHYNQVIMDSWRIVNQRDIIPTVPRLMGYCHVAQPFYLSRLKNTQLVEDDYTVDVIGEATPVAIFGEVLKGEKQLIQKLLRTEITMLRAIRDGSALMQHMEDFYYISLLECVSAKCNISEVCAALSQLVSSNQEASTKTAS